jgi:1,4-alpha-glucan branching enzyme
MIKTTRKLKNVDIKNQEAKTPSSPVVESGSALQPARTAAQTSRILLEFVKPGAKTVCVAGSFNEWQPEQAPLLAVGNGRWVGDLNVNPGRYEYLFVVDGQWLPDPNAKETVQNPYGGRNSVVTVSA